MGSVIDYIECPNCKRDAVSDFYYKTGEEYVSCENCGYRYSLSYKRDENGELVRVDKNGDLSFSNLILETSEMKPYAATKLKQRGMVGTYCGVLETKDDYDEFIDFCKSVDDIEFASVSKLTDDGQIVQETIIDNNEPDVDSAGFTKNDR